jgi:hypothetical protein
MSLAPGQLDIEKERNLNATSTMEKEKRATVTKKKRKRVEGQTQDGTRIYRRGMVGQGFPLSTYIPVCQVLPECEPAKISE